jgi:hypothetical protein
MEGKEGRKEGKARAMGVDVLHWRGLHWHSAEHTELNESVQSHATLRTLLMLASVKPPSLHLHASANLLPHASPWLSGELLSQLPAPGEPGGDVPQGVRLGDVYALMVGSSAPMAMWASEQACWLYPHLGTERKLRRTKCYV